MDIVNVDHVKKYFETGNRLVKAVDGVSLLVEKGTFTAIVGASGSGKTTLLNLIGGLYRPTGGRIIVDNMELSSLTEQELTIYRRRRVGFVFQDCSLVSELTVRENILFPLALDDSRPDPVFLSGLRAPFVLMTSWTGILTRSLRAHSSVRQLPEPLSQDPPSFWLTSLQEASMFGQVRMWRDC